MNFLYSIDLNPLGISVTFCYYLFFLLLQRCADGTVSNKEKFPTFARTEAPDSQVVKSVISLMTRFQWKTFQIIVESSPTMRYYKVAQALAKEALNNSLSPNNEIQEYKNKQDEPNWFELIQNTRNSTRSKF